MSIIPKITIEAKINGSWFDMTKDVISNQECKYGINGYLPTDRIASAGTFEFTLRNDKTCLGGVENYWTPNLSVSKSGWGRGVYIRLTIEYIDPFVKFYGVVSKLTFNTSKKTVSVTATDWFEYAANQTITLPTLQFNKGIDEVATTIVNSMPIKPVTTNFSDGTQNFPVVFDTVKQQTRVLQEINKVVLSEYSYAYLRHTRVTPEELRIENKYDRNEATLARVPKQSGFLLLEDGGYLLLEDGGKIILSEAEDAIFDNTMVDIEPINGEVLNKFSLTAYPRTVDTSLVVLFSISSPIEIKSGQTIELIGNYSDPTNKAQKVGGKSMQPPVNYTDYTANTRTDGYGTDITPSLNVTASYASNAVFYTIRNNGSDGFITKLQARGYGVYIYDSQTYSTEDTTSVNAYGYNECSIDMKYLDSVLTAQNIADITLQQWKNPRTLIKSVSFIANVSDLLMSSFIFLDIGSLVYIKENSTNIDAYYFIQAVTFTIKQGGVIYFTWNVVPALGFGTAFMELDTEGKCELDLNTFLGY